MTTTQALKAVATGQATPRSKTIFDYLDDARVKAGLAAVAGKFLAPERLLRLCINAVKKNPLLLKCDPQTVLGGMMTTAALGLEPNTIQQLAFLIPYGNNRKVGNEWKKVYECQFQVGARGFVALAYRSPRVKSIQAEAIHENDLFEHMVGTESFLKYQKTLKDRGELIGAFSYVRLADDFETACVLPLEELHKIRSKSETWRTLTRNVEQAESEKDSAKALQKLQETPWFMWEDDMGAKSAIKKHAKQLPIASSDLLIAASEVDNQGEAGRLDLKTLADPDAVRAVIAGDMDPPALENSPSDVLEPGEMDDDRPAQVAVSAQGAAAAANKEIEGADRPDTGTEEHATAQPQRKEPQEHPAAEDQAAMPRVTYATLANRITKKGVTRDVAELVLDEARGLPADQQAELLRLFNDRFPE
jgi:phage RecT family recombinase